jgi:hypothetical protein
MKDIISILLTTSCLAIAGLGIYLFSYNSHENHDVTQKGGKKKSPSIKKQSDLENINDNDCDDYESDYVDNNNINYTDDDDDDNDTNRDYNYKPKTKTKNNKTKKYTNKLSSSKKRYYY